MAGRGMRGGNAAIRRISSPPHPAQGYYNLSQNELPPFHLLVIK